MKLFAPTNCVVLVTLLTGVLSPAFAETLLDGSALPTTQGWGLYESGNPDPVPVTTDGNAIRINTWGNGTNFNGTGGPFLVYRRQIDISSAPGYSLTWSLQVHNSLYNWKDGGVAVIANIVAISGSQAFSGLFRPEAILFAEDRVLWGDLSDSYLMDTTSAFHTYRLDVLNTTATLYVDNLLALEARPFQSTGLIAFGDQSNDGIYWGDGEIHDQPVNGDFSMDFMTLSPIPEPSALSLLSLGALAWVSARRRKR